MLAPSANGTIWPNRLGSVAAALLVAVPRSHSAAASGAASGSLASTSDQASLSAASTPTAASAKRAGSPHAISTTAHHAPVESHVLGIAAQHTQTTAIAIKTQVLMT